MANAQFKAEYYSGKDIAQAVYLVDATGTLYTASGGGGGGGSLNIADPNTPTQKAYVDASGRLFANVLQSDLTGTGTISAAQSNINTPVSNATVVLAVGQGQSVWKAQLANGGGGFTSGTTLVADKSPDGGITWYSANFKVSGAATNTPVSSVVGPGPIELSGNAAGISHIRIRCSVLNSTETIAVTLRSGAGIGDVGLLSPIPAGSNLMGGVYVYDGAGSNKLAIDSSGRMSVSQGASQSANVTLQSAATGTGQGTPLPCLGYSTAVFTVTGTGSWTVTFQGTEQNAVNYQNLDTEQLGGIAVGPTVTATAPGTYVVCCAGMQDVIANVTQISSGSVTVTGHVVPIPWSSRRTLANIALWNGNVPGINNPVITQDQIRGYIQNGQGYTCSASGTTAGAASPGISIFNNSTSKNILIYSIVRALNINSVTANRLSATTTDPALGSAVTPVNMKLGGAASAIAANCSSSNTTTQNSFAGTQIRNFGQPSGVVVEELNNGEHFLLAANNANGIAVQFSVGSAAAWLIIVSWIEF